MGNIINRKTVGKGAIYLYLDAINTMVSGFLFWLILSKITSPEVIGVSSSIISFVSIFSIVSLVGMPGGIQRYLVKNITEKKLDDVRGNINSSLFIVCLGILGSSIFILLFGDWLFYSFNLDIGLSILSVLIMGFLSVASLLNAIIIPTLNTKAIAASSILATTTKLSITFILVFSGLGVYAILIGFMFAPVISNIILSITIHRKILNQEKRKINRIEIKESFKSLGDIFFAGTSFWIPGIINIVGSQLGTILVLISAGASEAGIYFLSFSIVTAIIMINSVLSTIAYPTISSMQDGRKNAVWRFMKISLMFTLPISFSIIFYSEELLRLFGNSYVEGNTYLQILLLSILPTTIISGVSVLAYAYGNNRQVISSGLSMSIPRILLYFIFVPLLGGNGAAFVYLLGAIIGCMISIIIAKRVGLKILWKKIGLMLVILLVLLILFKYSGINYIISICGTLAISYVLFVMFRIVNKEDIEDILKILPPRLSNLLVNLLTKISSIRKNK